MNQPMIVLILLVLFFGMNFGLRTRHHLRTTGTTGFRGISGKPGSPEWLGGVLFGLGIVLAVAAPLAELGGLVAPLAEPPRSSTSIVAVIVVLLGIAGTSWAQSAMGASWRIGVDHDERTEFIERGPFRWVRNPIFTFVLLTTAGVAFLLPNVLSIAAFLSLFVAIELQVRFAEEPFLRHTHGDRYIAYCQRVGRFIPGVGRTGHSVDDEKEATS